MAGLQIMCCWGHHFVADRLSSDATVVDLGMNQGGFATYIVANTRARVIGAEPVPELYSILPKDDRIVAHNVAVGGADGRARLRVHERRCASILSDLVTDEIPQRETEVPVLSFKNFLGLDEIDRVQLLKLDIEGAELDLLESVSDELLKIIEQITVEFHDFIDPSHRPRIRSILRRLRKHGFFIVNYSIRNHADILCVNDAAFGLSTSGKAQLLLSNAKQAARRLARRYLRLARSATRETLDVPIRTNPPVSPVREGSR
jgi:FkbM family methyltransferase